jgi:GT2 family glycosyltransferase
MRTPRNAILLIGNSILKLSIMILDDEKAIGKAAGACPCPSILAVVVLYRMSPSQSPGYRSLLASSAALAPGKLRLKIVVYDNTPESKQAYSLPDYVEYFPAARNDGIAGAYNHALQIAVTEDFEWLLTLDQDTTLPPQILQRLSGLTKTLAENEQVAAIVPHLVEGSALISPQYVGRWRAWAIPSQFIGIPDREITALNSATTWRVRYLQEIGGFDRRFWLDYLDHSLHKRTFQAGKRVYVAGDIEAEHALTFLDIDKKMTAARLENILLAESAFTDIYKSPLERILLPLRWAKRYCLRFQKGTDRRLVQTTLKAMLRQLFYSRRRRITQWEQSLNDHH